MAYQRTSVIIRLHSFGLDYQRMAIKCLHKISLINLDCITKLELFTVSKTTMSISESSELKFI